MSHLGLAALHLLGGQTASLQEQLLASSTLASPPKVPLVTIIVPAHNEALYLRDTLEALLSQTARDLIWEIIVVSDGSSDTTADIAWEYAERGVRVMCRRKVKKKASLKKGERQEYLDALYEREGILNGKSHALEAGLATVHRLSDIFFTVDADTVLAPNCVELLLAALIKNPNIACASGKVFPRSTRTIPELMRWFEYAFSFNTAKFTQARKKILLVSPGCCSAFRKDPVLKYGGFSGGTFTEDMELTMRLIIMGSYEIAYVPEAVCFPVEPKTFAEYCYQLDRWYRGFFQCLRTFQNKSIWRFDRLVRQDNRLGLFALYYTTGVLVVPFLAPIFGLTIFLLTSGVKATIIWTLLFKFILEWRPVLREGIRQGKFGTAMLSIPMSVFIGQPLGIFLFVRAYYREARGKELSWIKCRTESLQPTNELIGVGK